MEDSPSSESNSILPIRQFSENFRNPKHEPATCSYPEKDQ